MSAECKTIAIFGASSKIATSFISYALGENTKIIAFSRSQPRRFLNSSIEVVRGDITNYSDVAKVFDKREIDTTINFAADFSMAAKSDSAYLVNVEGEENVLNASEKSGVRRHIFISTIGVHIPGQFHKS